jgi:glyoxylase-like metal-dependent hydrolase (beta-lactamase superfamily II)
VPVPEDRIIGAADGVTFLVGNNVDLKVIETLGHASHHLSYYDHVHKGVFPGDAAGIYLREFNTIVPTTPPPFRLDAALVSLEKLILLNPERLYFSHFGVASNAVKRLQEYAAQIQLWANIALEGLKNNRNFEEIQERMLSEDRVIQNLSEFLKSRPIYAKTVLENSVQGFYRVCYDGSKVIWFKTVLY